MNMNDTPSAGKLTGAELARQRWEKRVGFVPDGCDEQGRIEAAHAACEYTDDEPGDSFSPVACAFVWICGSLAAWAGVIALVLALLP